MRSEKYLYPPASTNDANDHDPGSASRRVEVGNFLDEFEFNTMAVRLAFDNMAVAIMTWSKNQAGSKLVLQCKILPAAADLIVVRFQLVFHMDSVTSFCK